MSNRNAMEEKECREEVRRLADSLYAVIDGLLAMTDKVVAAMQVAETVERLSRVKVEDPEEAQGAVGRDLHIQDLQKKGCRAAPPVARHRTGKKKRLWNF